MIKIILCGCNGRMGKVISRCVSERDDCEIVAGVDMAGVGDGGYPVFPSPLQVPVSGDVIIDFSHPSVLDGLQMCIRDRFYNNCQQNPHN